MIPIKVVMTVGLKTGTIIGYDQTTIQIRHHGGLADKPACTRFALPFSRMFF